MQKRVVGKKKFQFVTMFHLVKQGKAMKDYECMESFFAFLMVRKVLELHWSDIVDEEWKIVCTA
jgi:hypothetical protein